MRNLIVVVLALVVVGYVSSKAATAFKAKIDFAERVEYRLDFVDGTSTNSIKDDVVHDARKLGIDLDPANIHVVYENSLLRTVAQQIVGNQLGTRFVNKQVGISVHYVVNILGISFNQDIVKTKIKQVQERQPANPLQQQLLNDAQ
jgi:hypothetical protein